MKPAVLYACLFVYVVVIFSMENDCQILQNNALNFDCQYKKMHDLITKKIEKTYYQDHMLNHLLTEKSYLTTSLKNLCLNSFLYWCVVNTDRNESIVDFCTNVMNSYQRYISQYPYENTADQFKDLIKKMNNIIERYLFLTVKC